MGHPMHSFTVSRPATPHGDAQHGKPDPDAMRPSTSLALPADAAAEAEANYEETILITRRMRVQLALTPLQANALGVSLAYIAAVTCGWMNLTAKSVMAMLVETMEGENQFDRFEIYLLLIGLVVALVLTLKSLSVMMSMFDAVVIVPIYQSLLIIMLICVGIFYFGEFEGISNLNLGIFVMGVCISLIGVVLLTQNKAQATAAGPATVDDAGAGADTEAVGVKSVDAAAGADPSKALSTADSRDAVYAADPDTTAADDEQRAGAGAGAGAGEVELHSMAV
jgi:hypothetical protein